MKASLLPTGVALRAWWCVAFLGTCVAEAGPKERPSIILATTTSTQDSGLLDVLLPRFTSAFGVDVKVIAVGSGAALQMGAKGNADVVLSHAPAAEKLLVDSGALVEGRLVMHNDFVIVGPKADPAHVKGLRSLEAVMKAIAQWGGFASRGDDSGTHKKELELWKAAGVEPSSIGRRVETGQGMGATLNVANEKGLYTLTDRATFLAQRKGLELELVSEGSPTLRNIYHVYLVSPARFPAVKAQPGRLLIQFLVARDTQKLIGEFGARQFGQPLFFPDALQEAVDGGR